MYLPPVGLPRIIESVSSHGTNSLIHERNALAAGQIANSGGLNGVILYVVGGVVATAGLTLLYGSWKLAMKALDKCCSDAVNVAERCVTEDAERAAIRPEDPQVKEGYKASVGMSAGKPAGPTHRNSTSDASSAPLSAQNAFRRPKTW